jgi:hypothetical protein
MTAIQTCPHCGKLITGDVTVCPVCGSPVAAVSPSSTPLPRTSPTQKKDKAKIWRLILVVLLIWCLLSTLLILFTYFFILPAQPRLPTSTPATLHLLMTIMT